MYEIIDDREKISDIERFGDVAVHPGFKAEFSVAYHRVSGHRNDGNVLPAQLFALSNGYCGFQAVHFGHLNIHEDKVEGLCFMSFYCQLASLGYGNGVASLFQQANGQHLVHSIVFSQENFQLPPALTQ